MYLFSTLYSHAYQAHETHRTNVEKRQNDTEISENSSISKEQAKKLFSRGSIRVQTQANLHQVAPSQSEIAHESVVIHYITIQGVLVRYLKDSELLESTVSQFLKRINYPTTSVDDALIDQCMKFCFLGLVRPYELIMSEFTDIFKRIVNDPLSDQRNVAFSNLALPVTLTNLAKQIPPELKDNLTKRMLELFLQIGNSKFLKLIAFLTNILFEKEKTFSLNCQRGKSQISLFQETTEQSKLSGICCLHLPNF